MAVVSAACGARLRVVRRDLKDCNIPAVVHGFWSTFRDWAVEETDHPREVIEAALAYIVGNKVETAYARSDLFERRRRLMDDWEALPCRRPPEGAGAPTGRTERLHAAQESATRHTAWTVREERRTTAGLGRIGSGRQPAVADASRRSRGVSSTSHATTAPGRPRAVGCDPRQR